jgi:uncharacterized repeat protein (TIGR02543 family)
LCQADFTISKDGSPNSQTVTITGSGYTDPRWYVDGELKGTGTGITIQAADYGAGTHTLSLEVSKNGLVWSRELSFTVDAGTLRTVIFKTNNGTGAIYATRTASLGSAVNSGFPGNPSRDGYTFSGWNTASGGGGSGFTSSTPVNADTTVYATWMAKTYTVTFMRNDGTNTQHANKTVTVPAVTVTDFPVVPARTTFNFAGWNTQTDGTGTAFGVATEVHGNITVYAQWAHENFGITLNLDAGTGAFSQGSFTVYKSGGAGSQTVTVTGSGYTNPRWYVDGELKGEESGMFISAGDYGAGGHTITLIIRKNGVSWSRESSFTVDAGTLRTVIFKTNDGTEAIYATRTAPQGNPINTVFPAGPARDGYTFSGWNTWVDGPGSAFTASTPVNADITVYAQWTAIPPSGSYTVTFGLNNGTDTVWAVKTVTLPATAVADFPANPDRDGYIFAGWNTQPDGPGSVFTASTTVSATITVYARWTAIPPSGFHTVTFVLNDGTPAVWAVRIVTSQTPTIAAVDFPADPARTGYLFAGWNTAPTGTGNPFTASTTVSAGITVHARWSTYSYTVTFDNNGGDTQANPVTKTVASPALSVDALPNPPSRSGYSFAGWNTASSGTGSPFTASTTVSAGITVYAQWTETVPGSYIVTFKLNDGTDTSYAVKTIIPPATVITDFPGDPVRTGYGFTGWNTAPTGTGSAFTAATTVSAGITVYARWTATGGYITLNNPDAGDGAFDQTGFTISKGGTPNSQTISVTGPGYTNPRWFVDGDLTGTGTGITIHAGDYAEGDHTLILIISKNGVSWSKEIAFTVTG